MSPEEIEAIAQRPTYCKTDGEAVTLSRAERDALVAMARRYAWLGSLKCNSLSVTRDDDHACNYMTAAEWIDNSAKDFLHDDPEEVERMKDTNTIWRLQVYPNTPVGFWVIHASTLDAALDAAMAEGSP